MWQSRTPDANFSKGLLVLETCVTPGSDIITAERTQLCLVAESDVSFVPDPSLAGVGVRTGHVRDGNQGLDGEHNSARTKSKSDPPNKFNKRLQEADAQGIPQFGSSGPI